MERKRRNFLLFTCSSEFLWNLVNIFCCCCCCCCWKLWFRPTNFLSFHWLQMNGFITLEFLIPPLLLSYIVFNRWHLVKVEVNGPTDHAPVSFTTWLSWTDTKLCFFKSYFIRHSKLFHHFLFVMQCRLFFSFSSIYFLFRGLGKSKRLAVSARETGPIRS